MSDPLADYQAKRDFGATPEPPGEVRPAPEVPRFVVQEHHATALHWDLRLERDGVLVSWALPKGIPPDPRVNHLAVHTEDHPMEYLTFHGEIPAGNYGAGTMTIWDTGTYDTEKWTDREAIVVFHGGRAQGKYALFRTRGNQWMIHRMDPPADPSREVWPGWSEFVPMEAVPGTDLPFPTGGFGVEVAWGGERALVLVSGGRVQFRDGRLERFSELRPLGGALGVTEVVLDGDLIVLGPDGRPSAELLAERVAAHSDSAARRLAGRHPATYMIYDLLWHDGHRTMAMGYAERRRRLEGLQLGGPAWQVPASHRAEDGPALLMASGQQGLPGVVAKRLDSPYCGGPAEGDWIFVPA